MELEADYVRDESSGTGTETAYTVEARYSYSEPVLIAGQIFDNRWRRVQFAEGAGGIPACPSYMRHVAEHGMLGYAAAQALRWSLHAQAAVQCGGFGLETRIVSHRISFNHKVEAVAAHDHIHGDDRSNSIPDWGKDNKPTIPA